MRQKLPYRNPFLIKAAEEYFAFACVLDLQIALFASSQTNRNSSIIMRQKLPYSNPFFIKADRIPVVFYISALLTIDAGWRPAA